VLVALTDRGMGIKPHELDQVFKAFHTTRALVWAWGLAISRSIIEAHGGRSGLSRILAGHYFKFHPSAGVRAA